MYEKLYSSNTYSKTKYDYINVIVKSRLMDRCDVSHAIMRNSKLNKNRPKNYNIKFSES